MIRHWVEAMGDHNPVYVDDEAARRAGFPGIIAPPTMLQAWIMRGLRASLDVERARAAGQAGGDSATDRLMGLLDAAGYTSVVATNCDQHYVRPLVLGDHLQVSSVIDAVSPEKETALGVGRFVTTRLEFTDQHGEPVATMRFRILKFRPRPVEPDGARPGPSAASAPSAPSTRSAASTRPLRPRPALTQDNRFFFEGARQHKLLIQRCAACGTLRHPPRPACAACRSFEWDTVTASGRGTVYSYVVNHHPQVPAFDYPLVIALVELEEGTRLVANVADITPESIAIGMPVVAGFEDFDDELTLPVFRPAGRQRLMDFSFSEEQRAVQEAAAGLFAGLVTPERVQQVESTEDRFDRELWAELARADLLGLAVPEALGGGGYGMVETALVLEAQGRAVAPVPLLATLVLGAMPVAAFGGERVQAELLPGVVAGERVLTAALTDVAADVAAGGAGRPSVRGRTVEGGLALSGTAFAVPWAHVADRVLVPASVDGGTVVAVVDPRSPGVSVERAVTTNREVHPHLHLDGARVGTDRPAGRR